jgi:hypothetical protein
VANKALIADSYLQLVGYVYVRHGLLSSPFRRTGGLSLACQAGVPFKDFSEPAKTSAAMLHARML